MIELVLDFVSLQSYLALQPTRALASELGVELRLTPLSTPPATRPPPESELEESIATRHQRVKANYARMDAERYAKAQGVPLKRHIGDSDSTLSLLGLLAASDAGVGVEYAVQVFRSYWSEQLDIQDVDSISNVLNGLGVEGFKSDDWSKELEQLRTSCEERHIFMTPMFWINGERYHSRQHLPLIKQQLLGKTV